MTTRPLASQYKLLPGSVGPNDFVGILPSEKLKTFLFEHGQEDGITDDELALEEYQVINLPSPDQLLVLVDGEDYVAPFEEFFNLEAYRLGLHAFNKAQNAPPPVSKAACSPKGSGKGSPKGSGKGSPPSSPVGSLRELVVPTFGGGSDPSSMSEDLGDNLRLQSLVEKCFRDDVATGQSLLQISPKEMLKNAYLMGDDKYLDAFRSAQQWLSDSLHGSMKISELLRRPGAAPLQAILGPELERQLADVATGQTMLQLLLSLQVESDMDKALAMSAQFEDDEALARKLQLQIMLDEEEMSQISGASPGLPMAKPRVKILDAKRAEKRKRNKAARELEHGTSSNDSEWQDAFDEAAYSELQSQDAVVKRIEQVPDTDSWAIYLFKEMRGPQGPTQNLFGGRTKISDKLSLPYSPSAVFTTMSGEEVSVLENDAFQVTRARLEKAPRLKDRQQLTGWDVSPGNMCCAKIARTVNRKRGLGGREVITRLVGINGTICNAQETLAAFILRDSDKPQRDQKAKEAQDWLDGKSEFQNVPKAQQYGTGFGKANPLPDGQASSQQPLPFDVFWSHHKGSGKGAGSSNDAVVPSEPKPVAKVVFAPTVPKIHEARIGYREYSDQKQLWGTYLGSTAQVNLFCVHTILPGVVSHDAQLDPQKILCVVERDGKPQPLTLSLSKLPRPKVPAVARGGVLKAKQGLPEVLEKSTYFLKIAGRNPLTWAHSSKEQGLHVDGDFALLVPVRSHLAGDKLLSGIEAFSKQTKALIDQYLESKASDKGGPVVWEDCKPPSRWTTPTKSRPGPGETPMDAAPRPVTPVRTTTELAAWHEKWKPVYSQPGVAGKMLLSVSKEDSGVNTLESLSQVERCLPHEITWAAYVPQALEIVQQGLPKTAQCQACELLRSTVVKDLHLTVEHVANKCEDCQRSSVRAVLRAVTEKGNDVEDDEVPGYLEGAVVQRKHKMAEQVDACALQTSEGYMDESCSATMKFLVSGTGRIKTPLCQDCLEAGSISCARCQELVKSCWADKQMPALDKYQMLYVAGDLVSDAFYHILRTSQAAAERRELREDDFIEVECQQYAYVRGGVSNSSLAAQVGNKILRDLMAAQFVGSGLVMPWVALDGIFKTVRLPKPVPASEDHGYAEMIRTYLGFYADFDHFVGVKGALYPSRIASHKDFTETLTRSSARGVVEKRVAFGFSFGESMLDGKTIDFDARKTSFGFVKGAEALAAAFLGQQLRLALPKEFKLEDPSGSEDGPRDPNSLGLQHPASILCHLLDNHLTRELSIWKLLWTRCRIPGATAREYGRFRASLVKRSQDLIFVYGETFRRAFLSALGQADRMEPHGLLVNADLGGFGTRVENLLIAKIESCTRWKELPTILRTAVEDIPSSSGFKKHCFAAVYDHDEQAPAATVPVLNWRGVSEYLFSRARITGWSSANSKPGDYQQADEAPMTLKSFFELYPEQIGVLMPALEVRLQELEIPQTEMLQEQIGEICVELVGTEIVARATSELKWKVFMNCEYLTFLQGDPDIGQMCAEALAAKAPLFLKPDSWEVKEYHTAQRWLEKAVGSAAEVFVGKMLIEGSAQMVMDFACAVVHFHDPTRDLITQAAARSLEGVISDEVFDQGTKKREHLPYGFAPSLDEQEKISKDPAAWIPRNMHKAATAVMSEATGEAARWIPVAGRGKVLRKTVGICQAFQVQALKCIPGSTIQPRIAGKENWELLVLPPLTSDYGGVDAPSQKILLIDCRRAYRHSGGGAWGLMAESFHRVLLSGCDLDSIMLGEMRFADFDHVIFYCEHGKHRCITSAIAAFLPLHFHALKTGFEGSSCEPICGWSSIIMYTGAKAGGGFPLQPFSSLDVPVEDRMLRVGNLSDWIRRRSQSLQREYLWPSSDDYDELYECMKTLVLPHSAHGVEWFAPDFDKFRDEQEAAAQKQKRFQDLERESREKGKGGGGKPTNKGSGKGQSAGKGKDGKGEMRANAPTFVPGKGDGKGDGKGKGASKSVNPHAYAANQGIASRAQQQTSWQTRPARPAWQGTAAASSAEQWKANGWWSAEEQQSWSRRAGAGPDGRWMTSEGWSRGSWNPS